MRTKLVTLCGVLAVLLSGAGKTAFAQTAHFVGVYSTLAGSSGAASDVAVDKYGNVYLAEYDGGTIVEIVAVNGSVSASSPIRTLTKCTVDCWSVAVDGSGNVYFIDYETIKEILAVNGSIPASPTVITITSNAPYPSGLAVDPSGNVYVADDYDGTVNEILAVNGTIPASPTIRLLASGLSEPTHLALDNSGNLYVSAYSLVEILAVNGGIPASPTVVSLPGGAPEGNRGVAVDSSGNVFGGGYNQTNEILAVNGSIPASPTVRVLTGASNGYAFDGVAVDRNENVFVSDMAYSNLLEISTAAANFGSVNTGTTSSAIPLVFTFDTAGTLGSTAVLTGGATGLDFADAGTGTCAANTAYTAGQTCTMNVTFTPRLAGTRHGAALLKDGGGNVIATAYLEGAGIAPQVNFLPGTENTIGSGFYQPWGVAVDSSGNVFIADTGNHLVKEIVAVNGSIPASPTINLLGSRFSAPAALALDGSGNLYVADFGNNAVYEILSAGGYTAMNTLGGGFNNPSGIAVDGSGNVFVADYDNNAVKEIPPGCIDSACVWTLGSGFDRPFSVAVDGNGNIFVADTNNFAVKEILAAGGYTTIKTLFSEVPFFGSVAADGQGNVFVADTDNNRILEIPVAGGYTTVSTVPGSFNSPYGLAVSGAGDLYVANTGNSAVSLEDFADPPALTFANTTWGSTSADSPQTVTLENVGNAPLSLPIPATGNNPSIAPNFTLDSSLVSACPLLSTGSSEPGTLAAGSTCVLPISFAPATGGTFSGSLVLTDNNLNAPAPSYTTQTITLSGTGTQATPTITWSAPVAITYGTALSATQLNATSPVAGAFTYSPAAGTVLTAGSHSLAASFTPTDTTDYTTATASVALTVNQATPTITWATPAPIAYGTALSATQLDATSPVAGTFTYSPAAGTVLSVGSHTLTATFTPTDTTDYAGATATVTLTVNLAPSFSLSASPASVTVPQGSSGNSTISVSDLNGFSGNVTLAVSGLPGGVSAKFSKNPTAGTSVLTFTASRKATTGTASVTIQGASGTLTATTNISLTVKAK